MSAGGAVDIDARDLVSAGGAVDIDACDLMTLCLHEVQLTLALVTL